MRRLFALAVVALLAAPASANEGPQVGIQLGYGWWNLGKLESRLAQGDGVGPQFAKQLTDPRNVADGGTYVINIGYNILGHVALEGQLTAHPWMLFDTYDCPGNPDCAPSEQTGTTTHTHARRGGFGVASGIVTWYPLESLVRPDRTFDLSLYGGLGYGIFGGGKPFQLGMDGMVTEVGGTLEVYPAPWISLGVTPRLYMLDMQRFLTSYDNRDSGGGINVPGAAGLGSFFAITGSIVLHFQPVRPSVTTSVAR